MKLIMFRRFYHCTCVQYNNIKQGAKLCKMLNPKNKKQWYPSQPLEANALPSIKSLTKTDREPGKRGTRRLAMLNKLFMKNITDIMSTGTVSMNVVGRGIEISQVKVTQDFQTVNVFWVCKGTSSDEETELVLNSVAGALRHELSTLRLMGEIPYVMFVKDRQEAHVADLDRRLAVADYGEDYSPTELGHILKSEFTLNMKLSPEMKAKIKQLDDQEPIHEEPLPEMTQNVFGLDYAKIMNRLMGARKKTRDAWSNLENNTSTNVISYRMPASGGSDLNVGQQKRELAEFLLKRQILQKKLLKEMQDRRPIADATFTEDKDESSDLMYDDDDDDLDEDESFYEEEGYELKASEKHKR